mmetsp:Transcript_15733/g.34979  ORF Transcript_15733/g.34979 Transcript_15733/m.34979 type:complete len:272 (+) Transcript_15733:401-1216(+)
MWSLFRVTTLEGWPEVYRDASKNASWAWMFFLTFIFLSYVIVLNLMTGVTLENVLLVSRKTEEEFQNAAQLKQAAKLREVEARLRYMRSSTDHTVDLDKLLAKICQPEFSDLLVDAGVLPLHGAQEHSWALCDRLVLFDPKEENLTVSEILGVFQTNSSQPPSKKELHRAGQVVRADVCRSSRRAKEMGEVLDQFLPGEGNLTVLLDEVATGAELASSLVVTEPNTEWVAALSVVLRGQRVLMKNQADMLEACAGMEADVDAIADAVGYPG